MFPLPRRALLRAVLAAAALAAVAAPPAGAAKLDPEANPVLDPLAEPLDRAGIDVLGSWETIGAELPPDRPRLAALAPVAPGAVEAAASRWLRDYAEGTTAAVALAPHALEEDETLPPEAFRAAWDAAASDRRLFVIFTRADAEAARHLRGVLEDEGLVGRWLWDAPPEEAGALFRSAGHHVVLDSAATRREGGLWVQAWMLDTLRGAIHTTDGGGRGGAGGRAPPLATSGADGASRVTLSSAPTTASPEAPGDPETLADAARLRTDVPAPPPMTVDALLSGEARFESVPGGILFGQTARAAHDGDGFGWRGARLVLGPDERVELVSPDGRRRVRLPPAPLAELPPCLAFAVRLDPSQSAVHVGADRRVAMAPEFVDSAVGRALVEVDVQPFRHVHPRGAQKSLVFDRSVRFAADGGELRFHVTLDVWYVVPAVDGTARPLLTLRYETEDGDADALVPSGMEGRTGAVTSGAREALARGIAPAARYAAWIGFFRWARKSGVDLEPLRAELAARDLPLVRTPRFVPHAS